MLSQLECGRAWTLYYEMFQNDLDWNLTRTAGGWGVDNLHLLHDLVKLAVVDYIHNDKHPTTPQETRAYYESVADHLIDDGIAVTGDELTAHFDKSLLMSYSIVKVHRARAYVQDTNVQFKAYMSRLRDTM